MSEVDKYRKLLNLRAPKERTGFVMPKNKPIQYGDIAQGAAAGLLGGPVDIVNLLTRIKKPVMGSDWIGDKLGADTDSLEFLAGQFLDPKAMLKAGVPLATGLGSLYAMQKMAGKGKALGPGKYQEGVIKNKGGNWLKGSVEDSLSHLKERLGETDPTKLAALRERVGDPNLGMNGEQLGKWLDTTLNKYVKNRMATPDDEIRKLAEDGILHINPEALNFRLSTYGKYPAEGQQFLAKSDTAKTWEGVSDNAINSSRAGDLTNGEVSFADNPWLSRLDPNAPVYSMDKSAFVEKDLGFDHLMDELSNALDPASGLPMNLRLTPEGMGGLSMEEALKKVHGINQFRAEKAKKANLRFAQAEGIPVHKQYDDNWKWLEYTAGDDHIADALRLNPISPKKQEVIDRKNQLESWLKQEGDTMGHCVGGYCDSVVSGQSRILSLRDNEGKSVATVELSMPTPYDFAEISNIEQVDPRFANLLKKDTDYDGYNLIDILEKPQHKDRYEQVLANRPFTITQVKGPGNKKPDAKAIPYIQDFVKSSGYKLEGDYGNTDLISSSALTAEERLANPGDYFTIDEIKEIRKDGPWAPLDTDPEW